MDYTTHELDAGSHVLLARLATADADALYEEAGRVCDWRQETIQMFGRSHKQPRLTAWMGRGWSAASRYSSPLDAAPWSPRVERLRDELQHDHGVDFDAMLANLYRDGSDTVGWHADDEANLRSQVIASVSLGACRRFIMRSGPRRESFSLGHGDVLIMAGACQQEWQHGVPRTRWVVGPRINLTFRSYER